MISWRVWVTYGALIAVAVISALVVGRPPGRSTLPSVGNPAPRGLRALYLYLEETGAQVSSRTEPLTKLTGQGVLVIAGPTVREISSEEVDALEQFVKDGGTLVYLAPANLASQPAMASWLQLEHGKVFHVGGTFDADALAEIVEPIGAAAGLHTLSVPATSSLTATARAVPIAAQEGRVALYLLRLGKGQIWIGSGTALADNEHLEKADNLGLWAQLAALGPIAFDEGHFVPPPPAPMSRALSLFFAQLAVIGLFFLWAIGTRLGPPRTAPNVRHRASREYLDAFAWLTRNANVEPELASALYDGLRRRAHERLGVTLEISDDEAARRIADEIGTPAEELRALLAKIRAAAAGPVLRPRAYSALARETAEIEARL
jgi:hypothetical protein